jgi:uncharacterized protein YukE
MEVQMMQSGAMPMPGMPAPAQAPSSPVSLNLERDTQDAFASAQATSAQAMQEAAMGIGQAVAAIADAAQMMAATSQQVAGMGASVAEATRVMAAPKRVVRDQAGRAIGVEAAL